MQLLVPLLDELAFNAWTVAFFDAMVPHDVQNAMANRITTPGATSRDLPGSVHETDETHPSKVLL